LESPLEKFKKWYVSLPASHQIEIAAMAGTCCLGFDGIDYRMEPNKMPTEFVKIIDDFGNDHFQNAGLVVTLRAFFDYFIYRTRSCKQGWKENESKMKSLAGAHESENFERMANEMEFKGKQWLSTCEKWKEFRDKDLNDEQIESYIRENSFKN
jgi:hypothetical protein